MLLIVNMIRVDTMQEEKVAKNKVIVVHNINITVSEENFDDYICITDIAKAKVGELRGADVVKNWMRNRVRIYSGLYLHSQQLLLAH